MLKDYRALAPPAIPVVVHWSTQHQAIFKWFREPDGTNLTVRARAGTGKTTGIIEGINQAPERSILLCAFNKRIQEELSARIANPNGHAQTLHSIGYACVRNYWERIAVGGDRSNGKVLSRADALSLEVCGGRAPDVVKRLVSKLHTKGREIRPHAVKMGDLTDLVYAFECEPDEQWHYNGYTAAYVEEKALAAMKLAAEIKPIQTGIDYADMIYLPVRNGWLQPQADLVVVDEAQDMTVAQLEIAMGVCAKNGRLAVVGDDRQAIYGFRGADSESLDRLKRELKAIELPLTVTYRCGRAIVDAASRLVPDFQAGPENPDGEILKLPIEKLVETAQPGDFILSRVNAPLVSTAMSLLKAQKRARIAGRDIGAGLKTLVRKLTKGINSVPVFLEKVANWESREVTRMTAAGREEQVDLVRDKASILVTIADGAKSVADIENRIDALFTDDGLGTAGVITCSSVHRSKGLEANRVFVLMDTLYPRGITKEEENIEYVAITRAKNTLVKVYEPVAV